MPTVHWAGVVAEYDGDPLNWGTLSGGPDSQPVYQVVVVDVEDEVIDVVAPCVIDNWEHVLKGVAEAELVIPLDAHGLRELRAADGRPGVGYPWVRIHRDNRVVYRGYPDSWRFDLKGGVVVVSLNCMVGHLDHQVIGGAERVNYVQNPGAEDGAIHWTGANGCDVRTTTDSVRGGTALKLTGDGGRSYAYQDVEVPLSTFRLGYYVSCWVKVPDGNHWPAGLSVVRYYDDVQFPDRAWYPDPPDEYVTGEWVRLDVGPIGVNANVQGKFRVRLSAYDQDDVYYDEVRVSRQDSTSALPGQDVATMVSTLFATAQTIGDLGYTRSTTPTGRPLPGGFSYLHVEHGGMLSALSDWDTDVDWAYRPELNRVDIGPPSAIGVERTDVVAGDLGAVPTDATVDSRDVVDEAIILGHQGEDVTREEGGYRNTTTPRRWFTVDRAPARATIKDLDRISQDTVLQSKDPKVQLEAVMPLPPGGRCQGDWVVEGFDVGDRMWAQVNAGPFDLSSLQQVVRMTVKPVEGDSMEVTLQEFPEDVVS